MSETGLNIVLSICGSWSRVTLRWLVFSLTRWTGAAQQRSSDDEKCSSTKPDVQGSADLPALGRGHQRVIKVLDDRTRGPRHRNKLQHTRYDKKHTGNDHDLRLGSLVLDAIGTLGAHDRDQQGKHSYDDGDDGHRPGSLEILRKCQHGVVHLTLHLPGALHHTGHPYALPDDLRRYDVSANESRNFPHRQGTGDDGDDPAQHTQGDAPELHSHRHGRFR